ncbi:MAG: acyl-CoA thioesterase [Rhizobiaceae bacterium]|nr:acyl-CoA thioesterase [Rhizobiaceae bacterium]
MSSNADDEHSFAHQITVRWSDCDPARIAYTGRIPNFALEAIDAWWEHTIGLDWYRLNVDEDIGTPFVHLSMDFRKTITPRHKLMCFVKLINLGNSSVRFSVVGKQDNQLCFEGEFVEAFVDAAILQKRGIPDKFRQILVEKLTVST